MKTKLHHPLWTHLPAAAMVALMVVALVRVISLPEPMPYDPTTSQTPDRWAAIWGIVGAILMSMAWIGTGVAWDELWARSERKKKFSLYSLIDELTVAMCGGSLVGAHLARVGLGSWFPFSFAFLWFVPAVLAAAVLESLRPCRPADDGAATNDVRQLQEDVAQHRASGKRWTYWEMHSPGWLQAVPAVSITLIAVAGLAWSRVFPFAYPLALLPIAAFAFLSLLLCGGARVSVSLNRVQVRVGLLGVRLINVGTTDIDDVLVSDVAPFYDSGPSGIWWGLQRRASHFVGSRAVELRTRQGKQYLIGSAHPDRLAAVIAATLQPAKPVAAQTTS